MLAENVRSGRGPFAGALRTVAVALIGVWLLAAGGCAYYNTFYNAKHSFSSGEVMGRNVDPRDQPTSQQKTQYQQCLKKCQALLDEYPDSGLVDDALFYMGKANFRLRDYRKATNSFDNLLANFPRSEFVEEALYLKAVAHLEVGEAQRSDDFMRQLTEQYPNSKFREQALFRLGEIHAREKRFEQAISNYTEFLQSYPKNSSRSQVLLDLGQLHLDLEEYAQAESVLATLDRKKATREQTFNGSFLRVKALKGADRPQEAADLLATLEKDADLYKKRGEALVLQGELRLDLGEEEQGLSILEAAAAEFKARSFEAEARYAIAEHLLHTRGPDEKGILDQLQTSIDNKAGGDFSKLVQQRHRQMTKYKQLKEQVEKADTTGAAARSAFQLAELLLVDLDQPQRALTYYRRVVEEFPEHPLAPRAAYAVGYIDAQVLAQPDSATVAFEVLRTHYPQSPQAQALDGALFLDPKPRAKPSEPGEAQVAAPGAPGLPGGQLPPPGGLRPPGTAEPGGFARARPGCRPGDRVWLDPGGASPLEAAGRALRRGGPGAYLPRAGG